LRLRHSHSRAGHRVRQAPAIGLFLFHAGLHSDADPRVWNVLRKFVWKEATDHAPSLAALHDQLFAGSQALTVLALDEAELTDGQGRALSAHRTQQSYIRYAKRTEKRVLAATRKRHAHGLANEMATDVQNGQQKTVQNEAPEQSAITK